MSSRTRSANGIAGCAAAVNVVEDGDLYVLTAEQWLPVPRDELFRFFADATNLERITPDLIRFRVKTPAPIEMKQGTRIDYRLRIRGLPMRWRSEITVWEPPARFVDFQLHGPYRLWNHEHSFEERDGGTLCRDRVEYRVPGGLLAPIVHALFVRGDVLRIFRHRHSVLEEMFGEGR